MARHGWKWLEMAGLPEDDWKGLKRAGNDFKWLDMVMR